MSDTGSLLRIGVFCWCIEENSRAMIVDVDIAYAADFIPLRGRKLRQGYLIETIPLEVREVAAADAPIVLRHGRGRFVRDVRTFDGLLFGEEIGTRSTLRSLETDLRNAIRGWQDEIGLHHGPARDNSRMEAGARIAGTGRAIVLARMTQWANSNLIVVDGYLQQRKRSPLLSRRRLTSVYGEALGSRIDGFGREFTPAWFAPMMDGQSFVGHLHGLAEGPHPESDAKRKMDTIASMFEIEIVDRNLCAELAADPRNLNWRSLGREAMGEFRNMNSAKQRRSLHPEYSTWISSLLEAIARTGAANGMQEADIMESVRAVISRPPGFRPEPTPGSDELFSLWRHDLDKLLADFEKHGMPLPTDRIDLDSWNLKIVASQVMSRFGKKVGLFEKEVLDTFVRLVIHLKDWRSDPVAAFEADSDERFQLDVSSLVSLLEDPAYSDVGNPGYRTFLQYNLEAVLSKRDSRPIIATDDELSDFTF